MFTLVIAHMLAIAIAPCASDMGASNSIITVGSNIRIISGGTWVHVDRLVHYR